MPESSCVLYGTSNSCWYSSGILKTMSPGDSPVTSPWISIWWSLYARIALATGSTPDGVMVGGGPGSYVAPQVVYSHSFGGPTEIRNLIGTGNPEATYTNPKHEANTVFFVVDTTEPDVTGEPYTLAVDWTGL